MASASAKALVGGGTGFVGRNVVKALRSKGYQVLSISRTAGTDKITWSDIRRDGLPDNAQVVINLSGELLLNPLKRWNDELKSALRSSRIDTTRLLAEAINKAESKPEVFITSSAVGYYKTSLTAEYTEDSPGGDFDFLSTLCGDWEKSAHLDVDVRQAILRIGVVLGKDGGVFQNMYLPFFLGVGGRVGSGSQWFPWVHVDDVTGMIVHAIENNHVSGVMNAVAPEPATNSEFTQKLASAMWRPALFPMPGFVINTIFGKERGSIMLEGQKVIPKRTLELGYQFKYPDLKSAIGKCISG